MKSIFNEYGITLNDKAVERFETYYDLLVFYNAKFNLTAITEKREVIVKHFVDSLLGADKIYKQSLIDVGSGGGFPAIPLKIFKENISLTMLEATKKKCDFLKEVINKLDLNETFIINGRAEDLAKDDSFREKFDCCTARAVARLNTLSEYCLPFVKVGGKFVSYKGDSKEEVLEAKNAIKILGGTLEEVKEYTLDGASRSLVVIKKVKSTDKKYPRGNGKERKNPL